MLIWQYIRLGVMPLYNSKLINYQDFTKALVIVRLQVIQVFRKDIENLNGINKFLIIEP